MMKKQLLLLVMMLLPMVANAADVVIDGIFYNLSQNNKTAEVAKGEYTGDVIIPTSITFGGTTYSVNKIGSGAFSSCKSLKSVSIPESVTHIGEQAFLYCNKLTTVSLSNGILSIGDYAFYGCKRLASIDIPNSVTSIGDFAFEDCSGLTSITLGNSLTHIGANAFVRCNSLTSVTIPSSLNIISEYAFYECSSLTSVVLGSGITRIDNSAFYGCSKLSVIYCFPKVPITACGSFSFYNTPIANATLYVPASLIEQYKALVPWYGFGSIEPLDYIDGIYYNFNDNNEAEVTYLDDDYNSYSGNVVIPTSVTTVWGESYTVTSIGEYAFKSCNNLSAVKIPNSVNSIGISAFDGCRNLTSITLPEDVSNIGNQAFRNCSSLSAITIPNSVMTINVGAFSGCSGLTSITIPSGVEFISDYAFSDCNRLASVFCLSESVPQTQSTAFDNTPINTATLYVPNRSIHLYKTTNPWNQYASFKGLYGNEYTLSYIIDGNEYKSIKVWEDEKIISEVEPTKEGHTFSGWSEIPEWMPAHDVIVTGSFTINKYKLNYQVDGDEYKSYEIEYAVAIIPEAEPLKEGYTFSGWSEIPEIMPAHDVTVIGSFTINKYKLFYQVDGEEYKIHEVEYGATITLEPAPTKEGYTFGGWSETPETMPAHDVTVTGSFTINQYTITYMIDNEVYMTDKVDYASTIIPPSAPYREGYDFAWGDYPETMPAHDITIYGTYTTGINAVWAEEGDAKIYSIDGRLLNKPQQGLKIVRMSNGTVKKYVVK